MKTLKQTSLLFAAVAVLLFFSGSPLLCQGRMGNSGGAGMGNEQPNQPNPGMPPPENEPTMAPQKTPSQLVAENHKLAEKIQPLLPQGTNLETAASGFKSLGQFVAAAHVSSNLGLPFDQIKEKMMSGDSLGKTIHELKPNMNSKDAKSEAKKADKQAKLDVKESKS